MKTVTLKFVVEDMDISMLNDDLEIAINSNLCSYPMFAWTERNSTAKEIKWHKDAEKEMSI